MGGLIEITLGILTAVGGFVDISELVFAGQAGSRFGFALIWVFVFSTVAIAVFGEISGRVAAVSQQPVFNLMRQRLGLGPGLIVLLASIAVTILTCSAEIGGMALFLQLLLGWPYRLMAVLSTFALMAIVWAAPFKWIERLFGLLGLLMIIFAVVAVRIGPPWGEVLKGVAPQVPPRLSWGELLVFGYFVVALTSSVLLPYETFFYSSGAIEEQWKPKDLPANRLTTVAGFAIGGILAISLLVNGAVLFGPLHIDPRMPGSVAMEAAIPFGATGLVLALLGMLFAVAGASLETGLSTAYALAQFLGWKWGRFQKPWDAPRFTLTWIATFVLALAVVLTGIKPLDLVEWAVVFSMLIFPTSYLPLLLAANDRQYMGERVNGWLTNLLGAGFYILICLAAALALPLYLVTNGGQS